MLYYRQRRTKYLKGLNQPIKGRIKEALAKLESEPPQGDIRALAGQGGFRLRVGKYRVLFGIEGNVIVVTEIYPRERAYRRR